LPARRGDRHRRSRRAHRDVRGTSARRGTTRKRGDRMSRPSPVLLAHSYFLAYDGKQVRKMKPYPPLATLVTAAVLKRLGIPVSLFDAMLEPDETGFADRLAVERPAVVALLEDNFNFLTKMCTTQMREAALRMVCTAKASGARVVVNGSDAADH